MIRTVRLTKRAEKSLEKMPRTVIDEAETWQKAVRELGIEAVQRISAFRDHILKGKLKKLGLRSVYLSFGYRLFYGVILEEVNHHDYKSIERYFGG
jgi:mRNA-degrading endonuclease YafQ of YafQ-DinJ toxin-antitoxin module